MTLLEALENFVSSVNFVSAVTRDRLAEGPVQTDIGYVTTCISYYRVGLPAGMRIWPTQR